MWDIAYCNNVTGSSQSDSSPSGVFFLFGSEDDRNDFYVFSIRREAMHHFPPLGRVDVGNGLAKLRGFCKLRRFRK